MHLEILYSTVIITLKSQFNLKDLMIGRALPQLQPFNVREIMEPE